MKKIFLTSFLGVLVLLGAGCQGAESANPVIPSATPIKRYVINDRVKCASARFACKPGEQYFSDEMGCGCEPVIVQPDTFCTEEYKPVCGVAGEARSDFGNRCFAEQAGAVNITEGVCETASTTKPSVVYDPKIITPSENSKIKSPVMVSGKASGVWFFEGEFSAVVTDKNEKELGRGIMKAQGEWMTEKAVKFSGVVNFTNPNNVDSGFIILKKNNPSGRPENDMRYRISVLFDAQKACTKEYKPVCGEVEVQCIKAPCPPLKQTFGNRCEAESAKAKNITEGACKEGSVSEKPLSLAALADKRWQFVSYNGETDFPKGRNLSFTSSGEIQFGFCNTLSGQVKLEGAALSSLSGLRTTLMACTGEAGTKSMEMDDIFSRFIRNGAAVTTKGTTLILTNAIGDEFVFESKQE